MHRCSNFPPYKLSDTQSCHESLTPASLAFLASEVPSSMLPSFNDTFNSSHCINWNLYYTECRPGMFCAVFVKSTTLPFSPLVSYQRVVPSLSRLSKDSMEGEEIEMSVRLFNSVDSAVVFSFWLKENNRKERKKRKERPKKRQNEK